MSGRFSFQELVPAGAVITARLGAGTGSANNLDDKEVGKAVKLTATDRYDLAAEGDEIEGFIVAVEPATVEGYTIGSVQIGGRKKVTVQGSVSVGALVVVGTPVAKGTALTASVKVKAGTAASQSGTTPFAYTARVPNTHLWRLISGAGTDGTAGLIERVGFQS